MTGRRAHEAVGAVACFSEFSRLRNGCKVNVFRWIFSLSVRSAGVPGSFGKGGGVSTCKDGTNVGENGADVGENEADVGKDGADVSVLRANFSLCRSLR